MKFNQTTSLPFLLVICCVAVVTADRQHDRHQYTEIDLKGYCCPKIKYISNVDNARVLGWWYRVFTSVDYPGLCYNNSEGLTMYAAGFNETVVNIENCCRSAANSNVAFCGSTVGSGMCTLTKNSGEFIYSFDNKSFAIYILDTDYDNFAIIYGCNPSKRNKCDELIEAFSRDYKMSDATEARVRSAYQQNGIDFSKAKPVVQGPRTPYTPNSRRNCDRSPF